VKINFTCETIISYVELGHLTCEKGFHISNHMWNFRNQSIKYTLQSHLQDFCNQHLRMRWNYLSIFCPYDLRIPHSLSANLLVVLKDEHGPEMVNNFFLRYDSDVLQSVQKFMTLYLYIYPQSYKELQWRNRQSKRLSPLRAWVRLSLRTHVKRVCQRSVESRGFPPGAPVSSHRECWQGGLGLAPN
jgi:hypothetical protein